MGTLFLVRKPGCCQLNVSHAGPISCRGLLLLSRCPLLPEWRRCLKPGSEGEGGQTDAEFAIYGSKAPTLFTPDSRSTLEAIATSRLEPGCDRT